MYQAATYVVDMCACDTGQITYTVIGGEKEETLAITQQNMQEGEQRQRDEVMQHHQSAVYLEEKLDKNTKANIV